jgi:hypothetical protein
MIPQATLYCLTCGEKLCILTHEDPKRLAYGIPLALLTAHAEKAHLGCRFGFELDVSPVLSSPKKLRIACLVPACRERFRAGKPPGPFELETECPIELIPALAIVYHAAHEGHALRIEWDGSVWQSPGWAP